jgi:hypothetical protein
VLFVCAPLTQKFFIWRKFPLRTVFIALYENSWLLTLIPVAAMLGMGLTCLLWQIASRVYPEKENDATL